MTDVSDSESYDKKDHIANGVCNQKHGNMRSSQVSLHSTTSSHPEIHPFFKVIFYFHQFVFSLMLNCLFFCVVSYR